jgi:transcriptional regulator NrdR family protein
LNGGGDVHRRRRRCFNCPDRAALIEVINLLALEISGEPG